MLIKKLEAKKFENSKNCTVWEYGFPNQNVSYAMALINGRYPDQRKVTNLECEESYFVISGQGIIHSDKGDFRINEGDMYIFAKNEIYWVEGENLLLALVNIPKWTIEQHKIVD